MTIAELKRSLDMAEQNAFALVDLTKTVISIKYETETMKSLNSNISYWHLEIYNSNESEILFSYNYNTIDDLNKALDMLIIGANLRAGKEV